jgi:hypothetical protein
MMGAGGRRKSLTGYTTKVAGDVVSSAAQGWCRFSEDDALVVALGLYVDDGAALPRASPADGRPVVAVPARVAAKLALHEEVRAAARDRRH